MEALYKSPLFEGLDQHTIDCLLDHNCRVRKYPPGEPVALQGDVYKELLEILETVGNISMENTASKTIEKSSDKSVIARVTGSALKIKVKLSRMNAKLNMLICHSSRN